MSFNWGNSTKYTNHIVSNKEVANDIKTLLVVILIITGYRAWYVYIVILILGQLSRPDVAIGDLRLPFEQTFPLK